MAANKRRKLDEQKTESPVSAIAALRQLNAGSASSSPAQESKANSSNGKSTVTPTHSPNGSRVSGQTQQSAFALLRNRGQEIDSPVVHEHASIVRRDASRPTNYNSQRGTYDGDNESRVATVARPPVQLSTYQPSKDNFKVINKYEAAILLKPGERLVILGQFSLTVKKGRITVMGANLSASTEVHYFFVPSSHSLPVIRCLGSEVDSAQLHIRNNESGLERLDHFSPLFASLWNENGHEDDLDYDSTTWKLASGEDVQQCKGLSYQILWSTSEYPKKRLLQPVIAPPQWNSLIATLTSTETRQKSIMVCGPKSSGKSTFVRLLSNRLCPSRKDQDEMSFGRPNKGLILMDIDPGQPEYSPPGQLSLLHIYKANFAPPFCHPIGSHGVSSLRSHNIAALSPAVDPEHYMACVIDLLKHYRRVSSNYSDCPLIINTPGWILGTGLEILVSIINSVQPSSIVYMSTEGPTEVVETLRDAAKSIPLHTLPSQAGDFESRTSAQLRTMQYMSYFHIGHPLQKNMDGKVSDLSWIVNSPITSRRPVEIPYDDQVRGIRGIMCLGESPLPEMLHDTINGCFLAIVVIDDLAAFTEARSDDAELQEIIHTAEGLPYFNPLNTIPPPPKYSHTIGMLLVRGIDTKQKRLQVLTPIELYEITGPISQGKAVILVSGGFDTPGWAYTEELHRRDYDARQKRFKVQSAAQSRSVSEEEMEELEVPRKTFHEGRLIDDKFTTAPWVERLHGSGGRGVGARVWKVRRDLGKRNDSE